MDGLLEISIKFEDFWITYERKTSTEEIYSSGQHVLWCGSLSTATLFLFHGIMDKFATVVGISVLESALIFLGYTLDLPPVNTLQVAQL